MLLRSSSTPVLGSLLSSFSESPNHHHHNPEPHTTIKRPPTPIHQKHHKLSFHPAGSLNYATLSRNPSPSISEFSDGSRLSQNGFRRAQSEENLQGLVNASCNHDEFSISNPPKRFSRRPNSSMLETIPSFSIHHARTRYEDDEDSDYEEEEEEEEEEYSLAARGSELNLEKQNFSLNDDMRFFNAYRSLGFEENKEHSSEMCLARGLGVDSSVNIGFGGDEGHRNRGGGGGGSGGGDFNGNRPGVEEHYKRLVEENPGNPLCLRNCAQFLYESKQDLPKAEEYYSRAILADPKDGEALSQYAKLVWELHHDQDRASSYFERAVHAAPDNSHVHAAFASFLWETEEDEDVDDAPNEPSFLPSRFHTGAIASANA